MSPTGENKVRCTRSPSSSAASIAGGATDKLIVDKQGRLLATEAEQEARRAEYFSEVLNRPPPTIEAEVQDPDTDLDVSNATPAIRSLKKQKAPEQDSFNVDLFKAEPEFAAQVLFAAIWEEKQLLDDWMEGVNVKIPKKGTTVATGDCLSPARSGRSLKQWTSHSDESKQVFEKDKDAQTRSSSSRPDLTLRNITEQCTEWQRQLYINDVDFDNAFASIHQ